jgi:muconolactone delta-isomerase
MRFLVISNPKHMTPPEMLSNVLDGMLAWVDQHTASGKLEFAWSVAGRLGGGGILNVDSPEELDAIMASNPIAPFSDVEVYALTDLSESLQTGKAAVQAMVGG